MHPVVDVLSSRGSRVRLPSRPGPEQTVTAGAAFTRTDGRFGGLTVLLGRAASRTCLSIDVQSVHMTLVVMLAGSAELVSDQARMMVDQGNMLLLGRPGESTLIWSPGSEGVLVQIDRAKFQVAASHHLGRPHRIAPNDLSLRLDETTAKVRDTVAAIARVANASPIDGDPSSRMVDILYGHVVEGLRRQTGADEVLLIARSIDRAIDHIRANADACLDGPSLAAAAGVTERTLREGFLACLGVSLAAYVQDVKIGRARDRLSSGRDSRSIAEVARATGFSASSSFARAYSIRYGETPTQTRTRAIKELNRPRD